jgi:hypothetical protein
MNWTTVFEAPLSNQWQFSDPTDFNVFRFTLSAPFNLSSISLAQAETNGQTQLFDLQRIGIRPESEICVIETPPFFSDRRIAVRGIATGSNKSLSGSLKIEGMSMAIAQSTDFSIGWTREGNQLISPSQELLLTSNGENSIMRVFRLIPDGCQVRLDSLDYALRVTGFNLPQTVPVSRAISWHLASGQSPIGAVDQTLFTNQVPALLNQTEEPGSTDYELGTKFLASQSGEIVAIRFYKAAFESGSHIGKIWTNTGTLLGSATFTNETAAGWQEQALAAPLPIQANTTYIVSVNINTHYVVSSGGFSDPISNGFLSSTGHPQNGVFNEYPGDFPSSSFNQSNYFVDAKVEFATDARYQEDYELFESDIRTDRFSTDRILLSNAPQRGRPTFGTFSLAVESQDQDGYLEGAISLTYRFIYG